ncbi:hypothetical protein KO494_02385 [Lacinutrix sp. C3R15]|uniref:hypothetical protein n=1 Tax=Flavobacteriaceae TaxID=49546 RepID=UPI001C0846AD|nr:MULTISPECIES: hypothetical protein [Flavobacteriaceae]MBU2938378.1 hypothetical protein [Lacinutrix sp. C3R15]MDO6621693.1 hypothetical protein [Oceanihabitans sp. 1_MG-2023]
MKSLKKNQLKSKSILGVSGKSVAKTFAVIGLVASVYGCEETVACDNDTNSYADPASSNSDSDVTSYSDDC